MKAMDMMTPDPVVVPSTADVFLAAGLMDEHRIRHLPVVDEEDLVGVLSERNVLEASGWAAAASGRALSTIRESMHLPVEVTSPHEDVTSVCEQLVDWRVGCLPVLDRGKLVGIVTDIDVMTAFARAVDVGALGADANPAVSERMTRGVATLDRTKTLGDAIDIMRERRIRHLPVVDDGRIVGVISDRDVRLCLGRGLPIGMECTAVATPNVLTITPDSPLSEAAEMLILKKIGALAVVENERLVGMLTTMDILEHCAAIEWGPA